MESVVKRIICALLLVAASGVTAARDDSGEARRKAWKPVDRQPTDTLDPAMFPPGSAGCLVIGHYILADGTVSRPRVMQGAYTKDVTESMQAIFTDRVITTVERWKFRHASRTMSPQPAFDWAVLGFRSWTDEHDITIALGLRQQDARVRDACKLEDLADWSVGRAIALDTISPERDAGLLAPYREPSDAFWISLEMTPPKYPPAVFSRGIEGCVTLGIVVGADGEPRRFHVLATRTSAGRRDAAGKRLEDAAILAASGWRFAPGPDNPQRRAALIQIPIEFALDDIDVRCDTIDPTTLVQASD